MPETTTPTAPRITGLDQQAASESSLDQLRQRANVYRLWILLWPKLLAIAITIGAWQLVVSSQWKPEFVIPPPARVFEELSTVMSTASFWLAVWLTITRAISGFAVAVLIGILVGVAVSRFFVLRLAIGSLITGLQTMPSIIWFPFAILLFQMSESTIMFVVVLGAAPSIANGLIGGIDHIPSQWRQAGTMMGMRGITLYRLVIIPAAFPTFVSGLKQGWAFAWRGLMAGELLVIVPGALSIGARLQGARELNDAPSLLSYIIVVLFIGIIADALFNMADRALRRRWGLTTS